MSMTDKEMENFVMMLDLLKSKLSTAVHDPGLFSSLQVLSGGDKKMVVSAFLEFYTMSLGSMIGLVSPDNDTAMKLLNSTFDKISRSIITTMIENDRERREKEFIENMPPMGEWYKKK